MTAYLVTVPGIGLYEVLSSDRTAALAAIAAEIWNASAGTLAVDTRFCTVQSAITVDAGVDLFR